MSVSMSVVNGKFRDLIVESGTNARVIFMAPNAPRPELPYTVIEYDGQKIHGFDDEEMDSTGKLRLYGRRSLFFILHFFGSNCEDEATQMKSMFSFTSGTSMMEADGTVSMAVAECGDIEYDYLLRDDTYEKYCTFDVRMNAVIEDGSTFIEPGYFEEVDPVVWTNKP